MALSSTVTLVGNLTRDPELRFTNSGMAVATFGVAVNFRRQKQGEWEEETSFFNVTVFGEMGENAELPHRETDLSLERLLDPALHDVGEPRDGVAEELVRIPRRALVSAPTACQSSPPAEFADCRLPAAGDHYKETYSLSSERRHERHRPQSSGPRGGACIRRRGDGARHGRRRPRLRRIRRP